MARRTRRRTRAGAALRHMTAAEDAAVTIGLRLPILFGAPTMASALEWSRAIGEKTLAFGAGGIEAGLAAQTLALRMAAGQVDGRRLPGEWARIADAATHSAYRAVAANAKRLKARRGR